MTLLASQFTPDKGESPLTSNVTNTGGPHGPPSIVSVTEEMQRVRRRCDSGYSF